MSCTTIFREWLPRGQALLLMAALAGCDSLLEVKNPNNIKQEDLSNPAAAAAIANGALATVARALGEVLVVSATVGDELKWVGSRDAYRELDFGNLSDPKNEFSDAAFPYVAEARWTADEAIRSLEAFDQAGTLRNRNDLARAYIYGAIAYMTIGDHFNDFVLSDRQKASPPIGERNMSQVYDKAVEYLTKAITITQATRNVDLELTALALRARARHAKGVWGKINPRGTIAADPLVNDPQAVADARAFLSRSTEPDWKFRFTYSATTIANAVGAWVNERLEMRVGDPYVNPTADNKKVASIKLQDPIDRRADPALAGIVNEMVTARQFNPLTVVSAREMHLIIAEAALAQGDLAEFTAQINRVRALDGLTPYSGQIPPLEMLKHARRVNLFMQGRRLLDMYRFRERSPTWLETSDAVRAPGTLFPIAEVERQSNCFILGTCS